MCLEGIIMSFRVCVLEGMLHAGKYMGVSVWGFTTLRK